MLKEDFKQNNIMPLLNILKYPDPFLKTKAEQVNAVDDAVKALIKNMIETMYAERGIGLAATQVGSSKRVIVLDVPDPVNKETESTVEGKERRPQRGKNLVALVNPVITSLSGETTYEEGCLSVPGVTADVDRAATIKVKALDREGKPFELCADGLFAIALQHEIDHLDGILFIDRLSRLKRSLIIRRYKKAMQEKEHAL